MNERVSTAAMRPVIDVAEKRLGWRERLLLNRIGTLHAGRLGIILPGGQTSQIPGFLPGPRASIEIHDLRLLRRLVTGGNLGLAEGYMAEEWDSPDLTTLLALGLANKSRLEGVLAGSNLFNGMNRLHHALRRNSRRGSRRNIAAHYDLGNAFFGQWLDPSMTYSSALFDTGTESLAEAQTLKYRRLADTLGLRPGLRVLEIGCGWGGFAEVAAREYGCHVVGLTLSREQATYARARMTAQGLEDKVEIRLQDYRDVDGRFDRIASIEMFEAVGEKNWSVYFDVLRRRLEPRGKAGLQVITIDDTSFERYRRHPDFIQRYIFPGGMLPGPEALSIQAGRAGLLLEDVLFFGASYSRTVRLWRQAFEDSWDSIKPLGFDNRFRRMWRYYLSYCEAGFDHGQIDVGQFVFSGP